MKLHLAIAGCLLIAVGCAKKPLEGELRTAYQVPKDSAGIVYGMEFLLWYDNGAPVAVAGLSHIESAAWQGVTFTLVVRGKEYNLKSPSKQTAFLNLPHRKHEKTGYDYEVLPLNSGNRYRVDGIVSGKDIEVKSIEFLPPRARLSSTTEPKAVLDSINLFDSPAAVGSKIKKSAAFVNGQGSLPFYKVGSSLFLCLLTYEHDALTGVELYSYRPNDVPMGEAVALCSAVEEQFRQVYGQKGWLDHGKGLSPDSYPKYQGKAAKYEAADHRVFSQYKDNQKDLTIILSVFTNSVRVNVAITSSGHKE